MDPRVDRLRALLLLGDPTSVIRELEPNKSELSPDFCDVLGEAYRDVGRIAQAKDIFASALGKAPPTHERYLYLAQLSEGREALKHFNEAISLLTSKGLHEELVSAWCAVSEVFLTDLCFERDAESSCSSSVAKAMQFAITDHSKVEASMACANLRISQDRLEEARGLLIEAHRVVVSKASDDFDHEMRMSLSRLLVEVYAFDEALSLLKGLIEEDDGVIEAWALLAQTHASLGDGDAAKESLERAEAIIEGWKEIEDTELDRLRNNVTELSRAIRTAFP